MSRNRRKKLTIFARQVLALARDNAANNDTMIEELGDIESPSGLPGFDGEGSEVRCFNHVTALAVRAILRQFDNGSRDVQGGGDAIDARLRELADELEAEEIQANAKRQRGEQSEEQRLSQTVRSLPCLVSFAF